MTATDRVNAKCEAAQRLIDAGTYSEPRGSMKRYHVAERYIRNHYGRNRAQWEVVRGAA